MFSSLLLAASRLAAVGYSLLLVPAGEREGKQYIKPCSLGRAFTDQKATELSPGKKRELKNDTAREGLLLLLVCMCAFEFACVYMCAFVHGEVRS